MDRTVRRLCTICARGGSKGVVGKNVRPMLGKPLIVHSIEQARASGLFQVIAVDSDSDLILDIAKAAGADYVIKRPAELATDQSDKLPAIRHCVAETERLSGVEYETLVDLDATSPLRSIEDIREAVSLLEETGAGNVITAMPARRSPYFNMVELGQDGIVTLSKQPQAEVNRRQDAPRCYDMNASIYVWKRPALFDCNSVINRDTRLYVMPEERSIDIDSELDFSFVEFIMSRKSAAKAE